MALTQTQGNLPKKARVRTLRPWFNVTRDNDGNPERTEVVVGEVVEIARDLAGELISCSKAEAVAADTPLGKPKAKADKAA